MKRQKVLSILSFFLLVIILAPTVTQLLLNKENTIVKLDPSEEDNKNEEKKTFDEKDIFLYITATGASLLLVKKKTIAISYIMKQYNYTQDIFLPPPKQFI